MIIGTRDVYVSAAVLKMRIMILILSLVVCTNQDMNFMRELRKRVENNMVRFAKGFTYRELCNNSIAMFSKPKGGYWTCKSSTDCPSFYECSFDRANPGYCCPTHELCEGGTPLSDENGILTCDVDDHCPTNVKCHHSNNSNAGGICCATGTCDDGAPLILDLNPYPILKKCRQTRDCQRNYACVKYFEFDLIGICCPGKNDEEQDEVTPEFVNYVKNLNEERIRRRKSMTRDVTYLIPMLGVPFLIILGMCAYQIKIENDRVKRDKIVEDWISMRKRTARKMPSADLTKSEFKYKGVLKVDGEIGDIKHALDAESSRSLESIKFDPKHNELVVIGSAVEQIEVPDDNDEAEVRESTRGVVSSESAANSKDAIKRAATLMTPKSAVPESGSKSAPQSRSSVSSKAKPSMVRSRQRSPPAMARSPDEVPKAHRSDRSGSVRSESKSGSRGSLSASLSVRRKSSESSRSVRSQPSASSLRGMPRQRSSTKGSSLSKGTDDKRGIDDIFHTDSSSDDNDAAGHQQKSNETGRMFSAEHRAVSGKSSRPTESRSPRAPDERSQSPPSLRQEDPSWERTQRSSMAPTQHPSSRSSTPPPSGVAPPPPTSQSARAPAPFWPYYHRGAASGRRSSTAPSAPSSVQSSSSLPSNEAPRQRHRRRQQ